MFKHHTEVYKNTFCKEKYCIKRHPKECRYRQKCRNGDKCCYRHFDGKISSQQRPNHGVTDKVIELERKKLFS